MVVLLYPEISNFTFQNVKNFKCKIFLIDFLDELGNFKQKNVYTSKCNFILHFTTTGPIIVIATAAAMQSELCNSSSFLLLLEELHIKP